MFFIFFSFSVKWLSNWHKLQLTDWWSFLFSPENGIWHFKHTVSLWNVKSYFGGKWKNISNHHLLKFSPRTMSINFVIMFIFNKENSSTIYAEILARPCKGKWYLFNWALIWGFKAQLILHKIMYSRTSKARTSLVPWKFVRDMGSSSHSG